MRKDERTETVERNDALTKSQQTCYNSSVNLLSEERKGQSLQGGVGMGGDRPVTIVFISDDDKVSAHYSPQRSMPSHMAPHFSTPTFALPNNLLSF